MPRLPSPSSLTGPLLAGAFLSLSAFSGSAPGYPNSPFVGGSRSAEPTCITSDCHTEYVDLAHSHAPVVLGRCLICHEPEDDSTPYEDGDGHYFELVARDGELCAHCHESQTEYVQVHYPLKRQKCVACHDPHGSEFPAMMRHERMADNCYECHEPEMEDESEVHAPVLLGECTTCHSPHGSPYRYQLVASGSNLCLRCHTEKQQELAKNHVHRPVLEDCGLCHDPHDGPKRTRLREPVPGLCLGCHEQIKDQVTHSRVKHEALNQNRSCLYCHDPHAADYSRLLSDIPKNLCLSCHDDPMLTKTGIIRDMKSFLEKNHNHHGPIREGDCGACHNPHGSNHDRILRKSFPKRFYAPFRIEEYELCFSCHQESMVLERSTETLTGFRNGTNNLHFVHVNREKKGRTCRACHDVHASNHPKHITDFVPFGPSFKYWIEYQETDDGGGCGPACHKARQYNRRDTVENK